jgi:lysozyme
VSQSPYLPPVVSDVVVDISHYETVNQQFALTKQAGLVAVILKATQGTGFIDPTFLERATEARHAGLLVGAYHFLDGSNPAQQVAHFLTVAASEGGVSWLALDWESNPASQASVMQAATAAACVQATTGRWPVLYTIRSMLQTPNKTLSNCALWLAEYGTRPICPPGFAKWEAHQYTDGIVGPNPQPVPGIGVCDRSVFAGTIAELKAWWANPVKIS